MALTATHVRPSSGLCSRSIGDQTSARARCRNTEASIGSQHPKHVSPLSEHVHPRTTSLGLLPLVDRKFFSEVGTVAFHRSQELGRRFSPSLRSAKGSTPGLTLRDNIWVADGLRSRGRVSRGRCQCRASARGREPNARDRTLGQRDLNEGQTGSPVETRIGAEEGNVNGTQEGIVNESLGEGGEQAGAKIPQSKFRSSWDEKDITGRTYIENLGKASENVNIVVGAKAGMIDHVFVGDFLGKEADIVFKYRQKVTRQFGHIQGDYYIAPSFMEKVVTHITKNYLVDQIKARVPLILGVWGGKGQGKSFQIELIFRALGLEPVIMSAGELESEWAGTPAHLIRDRYRTASQVIKTRGKMSCLVINDIDAGAGRFENTQMTVNTQMVMGTLMNLADNPTRVSVGQEYREADVVPRVPIILTGNDLSTLWAPLIRDGRMDKFYWNPSREDTVNIVTCMYKKDGLAMSDIETLVDTFPDQALDFYGAMRSRTYDDQVKKWLDGIGGPEKLKTVFPVRPGGEEPELDHYQQTLENLVVAGKELVHEQDMVMELKLSDEYMNSQPSSGGGTSVSLS